MNSATATMHTRSILQNGAAVVIFIAGLCIQAMTTSAQSILDGVSNGITVISIAENSRSLTGRPPFNSTATRLQR